MKKYFLHLNGSNVGPYSYEDLRAMRIQKTTPVWYDGLGNWKNAGDVSELRALFSSNASTFTTSQNYSNPAQRSTYNFEGDNLSGNTGQKKSNGVAIGIIIGVAVLIFAGAGIFIYVKKQQEERMMNEMMMYEKYLDEEVATMDMEPPAIEGDAVIEAAPPVDYGSSTFAGRFNNYSGGILTVIGTDENNLVVSLRLDPSYGCTGEVTGKASLIGDDKIQMRTSSGCKLTIKYSAGFVKITESSCESEYGDGCSFEGIYSKE
jgi:hypothetical protein